MYHSTSKQFYRTELPAPFLDKLRERAMAEKDKQSSSKEIRLLRLLLRTDDASAREKLLEDAFTPKDVLLVRTSFYGAASDII